MSKVLTNEIRAEIEKNIQFAKNANDMDYGAYVSAAEAQILLDEIDRITNLRIQDIENLQRTQAEYKVHYDRIFEKSVIVPTKEYIDNASLRKRVKQLREACKGIPETLRQAADIVEDELGDIDEECDGVRLMAKTLELALAQAEEEGK